MDSVRGSCSTINQPRKDTFPQPSIFLRPQSMSDSHACWMSVIGGTFQCLPYVHYSISPSVEIPPDTPSPWCAVRDCLSPIRQGFMIAHSCAARSADGLNETLSSRSLIMMDTASTSYNATLAIGNKFKGKKKVQQKAAAEVAIGGLMTVLKITKEASAAFPPLESATGGLLVIAEIVSKVDSTQGSIAELEDYVGRLNTMIAETLPSTFDRCSEKLKKRILAMTSGINEIALELQGLKLRTFWSRAVTVERINGKVQDAVRRLSWLMNDFIVGGTIDIELAVDELHVAVDKRFDHVDSHLDELGQKADAILDNQAKYDGLPCPRHAKSARWDHHSNRVICEQNTRLEVLDAIYRWMRPNDLRLVSGNTLEPLAISGPRESPVFWLSGVAGAGKSTLAQTAAEWCDRGDHLGASFFCSRDSSECSNLYNIFPTIAYQLGLRNHTFRERLADALRADRDVETAAVARQLEKLIVEPLELVDDFPPSIVIIDALDECEDDHTTSRVLLALSHWIPRLQPLMFFITSRPELQISRGFSNTGLIANTQHLVLNEIPPEVAEKDIRGYIQSRLLDVSKSFKVPGNWPSLGELEFLVHEAHGLFIFAATAIKYIQDDRAGDPREQLTKLLRSQQPSSAASPHAHLDRLYLQVLRAAFPEMERAWMARLKMVLGALVLVRDRLSSATLEVLLDLQQNTVQNSLRLLHSLILVPDSADKILRLIHPSIHDFLINPTRCTDCRFIVDPKLQHTVIAQKCLETLNALLRRDICAIGDPSKLNIEVPDLRQRIAENIPSHLQYACRHWALHLSDGDADERVFGLLRTFCEQHLLHWLEVMSLLGALGDALGGLVSVQIALQSLPLPPSKVLGLLHDCERIIRYFHPGLGASCLQAYYGIAPFCPRNTEFHRQYFTEASNLVKLVIGAQASWSPCINTMEGHTNVVASVGFSPQGDHIVSGSWDKTVRIWDVKTGTHLQTFTGHSDDVIAVVFHPNGRYVFSASKNRTIAIWDMLTGGVLQTLRNERIHTQIYALACSSDGKVLASGSRDGRIFLWDIGNSEEITLRDTTGEPAADPSDNAEITSLVFSRDSMCLVCGSGTGVCTVWDIRGRAVVRTYQYRNSQLLSVALSHDEELLAGSYGDGVVVVWKFHGSSTPLHVLEPSRGFPWSIQFSPTDDILAAGYYNGDIHLWSPASGQCVGSLVSHTGPVNSISFSQNGRRLCSASHDGTVRIWEVAPYIGSTVTAVPEASFPGPPSLSRKLLSSLHRRAGSASRVERPNEKNARLSSHMQVVQHDVGHHGKGPVRAAVFSPDGRTLATGARDGLVKLWSTQTGQLLRDLAGHERLVSCIAFSHDGILLASGGRFDHRVIVWDTRTAHHAIVPGHSGSIMQLAFLRDGVRLISSSMDGTLRCLYVDKAKQGDIDSNVSLDSQLWRSDVPGPGLLMSDFVFALSNDEHLVAFSVTFCDDDRRHPDTTLRVLHFESKTVIWSLTSSEQLIVALSFASNGIALAALSLDGLVRYFTSSRRSVDRDSYGLAYEVSTGEWGHGTIRFSSDDDWIITDNELVDTHTQTTCLREYDPTLATRIPPSSFPRAVFLRDQWLWKTPSSGGLPRRVCWVPRDYRFNRMKLHQLRGSMAVHNDLVALGTESGRVVLIDLSQAL